MNIIIDHNTEAGHNFIKQIKYKLRQAKLANKVFGAFRKKILDLINNIKEEKIKASFLRKINN